MLAAGKRTVRLLGAYGPLLVACYLAGMLLHHVLIQLAGFVGAWADDLGILLLPLAVLARLVALVAMLVVLRDGLSNVGALPEPGKGTARRFTDALLAGILPFVAFYAARGYLADDVTTYFHRLLEVRADIVFTSTIEGDPAPTPPAPEVLGVSLTTVAVIVAAYGLRWLWGRYRDRLPGSFALAAVYLETLWIYLSATIISRLFESLRSWIDSRQAMVWLADLRASLTGWLAPLGAAWDTVALVIGEAAKVTIAPLAWLAIVGVIYGRSVQLAAPRIAVPKRAASVEQRFQLLPAQVQTRLGDLWRDFASRFTPIWKAVLHMRTAGPAFIGAYVLAFTAVLFLEGALRVGIFRAFGPHDINSFWLLADSLILLAIPLIIEPIRMALVASSYDEMIGISANTGSSAGDSTASESSRASSGTT
ncbi:hypothetical protein [Leucobacter aridicollis]|uniref:hypothetical protein n=1 Tax=Leucobacter aridicollis TaxID=283878 RepID=UPI002169CE9A|nr:hypothetical protein [Leucobacter aridicollis]MCS3428737.1 hypothetical protein [Leucobacter aridicollis]